MSGVSALIDVYKMSEVSVEVRIRLLNALGNIINWELGANATEPLVKELVDLLNSSESTQSVANNTAELQERIAKLEALVGELIEAGDAIINAYPTWVAEEDNWDALVEEWKERDR